MSFTLNDVLVEARSWIGTPFVHQGRTKGRACDCLGLMIGVAKAVGYAPLPLGYDERRYGPCANSRNMGEGIAEYCDKLTIDHAIPGDWLWIAYGKDPTHLALLTDVSTIIHAQVAIGRAGSKVMEARLSAIYLGMTRYVFRFRGMDYRNG